MDEAKLQARRRVMTHSNVVGVRFTDGTVYEVEKGSYHEDEGRGVITFISDGEMDYGCLVLVYARNVMSVVFEEG